MLRPNPPMFDYRDANGRPFYPKALGRDVRSERAMILAMAEMYVQGVSTRKVTAILEELCGLEVTSTPVSRVAAELDEQLAAWLEQAAPEAITVLMIPLAHRRRLRTTNGLERLNKEIKRRTRVATLFPNEASLLRLASAVLSEISDNWKTERAYLNMEAR